MDENCWTVGVLGDSSLFVSVSFDGVFPPCGLIKWHFLLEMFNYKTVHVKISCPIKSVNSGCLLLVLVRFQGGFANLLGILEPLVSYMVRFGIISGDF